jgi:hypothetical protein
LEEKEKEEEEIEHLMMVKMPNKASGDKQPGLVVGRVTETMTRRLGFFRDFRGRARRLTLYRGLAKRLKDPRVILELGKKAKLTQKLPKNS